MATYHSSGIFHGIRLHVLQLRGELETYSLEILLCMLSTCYSLEITAPSQDPCCDQKWRKDFPTYSLEIHICSHLGHENYIPSTEDRELRGL